MSLDLHSKRKACVIGNQAFSLLNFRGPLIAEMLANDLEVFALAPDFDDKTRAAVQSLGAVPVDYSLSRTGMNPLRDAMDMMYLARLLRRLKPDIILAYIPKPVIYGTLAAWMAGVPQRFALITGLGYAFTPSAKMQSLKRRLLQDVVMNLYRHSLKHAAKVFFQNQDDCTLFIDKGVVSASQSIRINGTGVDLDMWHQVPCVTKPVTFLLAARLLREKGIVEFVEASRQIRVMQPESRFILLGGLDSNPGALTRSEVEAWVREGIIEWPGHVSDVRQWIAQASVFVLPSYYREGVPRSIQEAMAMGRPVITTDAPGCRDTVIDGENGFLVPVRDIGALVEAMARFVRQPDLMEKMGKTSRQLAEERFDVHRINQVILQEMGILELKMHPVEMP